VGTGLKGFRDDVISKARFNNPQGLAYDSRNDILYVADTYNHAIRRISFRDDIVTTILGTGEQGIQIGGEVHGSTARISYPTDLELRGGRLYITMTGFNQLWELDLMTKKAKPLAGSGNRACIDGLDHECSMNAPRSMAFTDDGNIVFIDSDNSQIRQWSLADGVTTIFANEEKQIIDGRGVSVQNGIIYITDGYGNGIHELSEGQLNTVVSSSDQGWQNGKFSNASFNEPTAITFYGGVSYVTDCANGLIRTVNFKKKRVGSFEITDLTKLPRYEPAITGGKKFLMPSLDIGSGENTIDIDIVIEDGYEIVEGGFHDAYMEDRYELNQLSINNISGKRLQIKSEGEERNIMGRFEFQITLTKTDKPGSLYYESLQVIMPFNPNPAAENRHTQVLNITKDYNQ
jgi:sugar lactone lactonase YvrE